MQIFLISALSGALVYSILTLILSSSSKTRMERRLSKYFKKSDFDEVQLEVLKEKRKKAKKNKPNKFRLASDEFSNYLAMSGVKLRATEFVWSWVIIAIVPALLAFFAQR